MDISPRETANREEFPRHLRIFPADFADPDFLFHLAFDKKNGRGAYL